MMDDREIDEIESKATNPYLTVEDAVSVNDVLRLIAEIRRLQGELYNANYDG